MNKNESLAHGTPTMRLTMERMKDDATVNGDVGAVRLCAKKSVVSARSLVTKKDIMKVYDKMEEKSNLADFKTFKQEI